VAVHSLHARRGGVAVAAVGPDPVVDRPAA